ncbi:hypothetical protein [Bacillus cereus]|uniref:hypothetical protein n=1 Tax=Bacillus cereus TaxID=1396 RepID=UPI00027C0826|nr:hypothetical protein [Bacillus cereus]EJV54863.1 hypothetical protein IEM_05810 [Bacillus cereus BAG6O-2]
MKSYKRHLESQEIRTIVDTLYSKPSFQETIDTINKKYNIKPSRYRIEIAESWNYASQKTMKVLVLSYDKGNIEMMYVIQDHKEIITFTSLKNQKILAA